ncbi:MAG: hypothetical protein BroJett021_27890 [Chloroflexota bacterium]|nr:MAG: hypothetical protein BroJett021_27890 [Chloroflexota bacterium]
MANPSVTIRLSAEDKASPVLKQVQGALNQMGAAGTMVGHVLAGGLLAGVGAAKDLAITAVQTAWALGEMGAQSQRMEASFERLASGVGASGQAMLRAMQEASRGTVSNADLMMAANRALVLGVADSAEEMAALVEAAIIRGRDVGVSAAQAVNDLVTGIGRMSPQILDNLGIVGAQQAIEAYAQSLGKTSEQLTDVEKKQALLNAVLASTKGVQVVDDAASSFERMNTALQNAQSALGELFSPAVAAIAQALADAVNGAISPDTADMSSSFALLGGYFSLMGQGIQEIASSAGDAGRSLQLAFGLATPTAQELTAEIATLQERLTAMKAVQADQVLHGQAQAAQASQVAIDQLNERILTLQRSLYAQNAATHDSIYGVQMLGGATRAAASDVSTMTAAVLNLDAALKNMAPVLGNLQNIRQGAISRAESLAMQAVKMGADPQQVAAMLGETTDAIWNMGLAFDATTEAQFLNKVAAEGQLASLEGLVGGLTDAQKAASKFASGGLSDMDRAFQNLESRVSGVLSQSLSLDVGVDPADFLPREDAINENARRLAAIMRDGLGDQEWMEEFKAEVPAIFEEIANSADPQGAAARILKEFQAGLRPELLDRDAVKERVRQMILGEQSMAAVAGEIAQELAQEMGVSLGQVQRTMGAMGIGGADGTGLGEQFINGIDGAGIAAETTAKIATAFKENEGSLRSSGAVVGAWWGEGFMTTVGDNVPIGLLEMLTVKLLPMIQTAIARQSSTTAPDGV